MAMKHFSLKNLNIKIKTITGKSVVCGKSPGSFDGSFSISQNSLNVNVSKVFVLFPLLQSLHKHFLENLLHKHFLENLMANSRLHYHGYAVKFQIILSGPDLSLELPNIIQNIYLFSYFILQLLIIHLPCTQHVVKC